MTKKIIALANQKGGTGKTTTSANLAVSLAALGYSVVLADLDPQASLSYCFGYQNPDKSIEHVLSGKIHANEVLVAVENIQLLPGDIGLADFELDLMKMEEREFCFKRLVSDKIKADILIIDCPPSLSLLTINALSAATHLLIPMQLEVLSTHGLGLILASIAQLQKTLNPALQLAGVLPVLYDKRKKITLEIRDFIIEQHGIFVFDQAIRPDVRLIEAPSFGKSIFAYAPNSKAAGDYADFAAAFASKIMVNDW